MSERVTIKASLLKKNIVTCLEIPGKIYLVFGSKAEFYSYFYETMNFHAINSIVTVENNAGI